MLEFSQVIDVMFCFKKAISKLFLGIILLLVIVITGIIILTQKITINDLIRRDTTIGDNADQMTSSTIPYRVLDPENAGILQNEFVS